MLTLFFLGSLGLQIGVDCTDKTDGMLVFIAIVNMFDLISIASIFMLFYEEEKNLPSRKTNIWKYWQLVNICIYIESHKSNMSIQRLTC